MGGGRGGVGRGMRRGVGKCVACCYVTMKPNGQKNDVRCEYTCGAPKPLLV